MFVSAKKYEYERKLRMEYQQRYSELVKEWNRVVGEINARGGWCAVMEAPPRQLDKADIQKLLSLCHPDKHGGKEIAQEMTVKLLKLRG